MGVQTLSTLKMNWYFDLMIKINHFGSDVMDKNFIVSKFIENKKERGLDNHF